MGSYLSQPITEKETEEGELHNFLLFGACAMQGWRRGMEDEHIALALDPPKTLQNMQVAMFAVWDGHGGKEVARFVKKYMHQELVKLDEYNQANMDIALIRVFHRMDEMLWDTSNHEEVLSLKTNEETTPQRQKASSEDIDGASDKSIETEDVRSKRSISLSPKTSNNEEEVEEDKISTSEVLDLFKTLLAARDKKRSDAASDNGGGMVATSQSASQDQAPPTRDRCELPSVPITAGCTSVVCVLLGKLLYVANAGDSRAVMCRSGKALTLSEDHKPTQQRELDRIKGAGGFVTEAGRINGNLNLSRSIGDLKYKQSAHLPVADQMITAEPDITSFHIDPGTDEFMIIACDGIWDCFSNEAAVHFVRTKLATGMTPLEISKAACDECLAEDPKKSQGIGGDNMTCMVVVFKPQGLSC